MVDIFKKNKTIELLYSPDSNGKEGRLESLGWINEEQLEAIKKMIGEKIQ